MSGVYNDREIKALRERGDIVIEPYDERRVQSSSVDVTLGGSFYRMERGESTDVLNPFDADTTASYFKPFEAKSHADVLAERNMARPFGGIPLDRRIVVLGPGERVLGHTREAIGIVKGGTTQMQAKSSLGRYGIGVCLDAGWGDEGYCYVWTMEIINMNAHRAVVLAEGMPIAQIIFYKMRPSSHPYNVSGHYRVPGAAAGEPGVWRRELMLPRTFDTGDLSDLPMPEGD